MFQGFPGKPGGLKGDKGDPGESKVSFELLTKIIHDKIK